MNKVEEICNFIDEVKEEYLCFLERNASDFPYCCDTSSQILMSYIVQKFDMGSIQVGYHKNSETFHVWGEVDENFIDFTFVQFLEDGFMIEELSEWDEPYQLYHELVNRYYGDVILSEEYKNELVFVEEVPCLFKDIANTFETFPDYLAEMKKKLCIDSETEEFINHSYDKSYRNVISKIKKAI